MKTNELVSYLSEKILKIKGSKPILIAFDGVDTSGKTTLADNVYNHFQSRNIEAIRISIDKFHNHKDIRLNKGEYSPEGFFYDSFNYEKIMECVINPVKNGERTIVSGIYDYKVENEIGTNKINITKNSIILFDGIFMNRDELYRYWDLSIFLDITFETVLNRALVRDINLFGNEETIQNKYLKRYIPGEEIYLDQCKPKERANVVVDNNDWNNPRIVKENI